MGIGSRRLIAVVLLLSVALAGCSKVQKQPEDLSVAAVEALNRGDEKAKEFLYSLASTDEAKEHIDYLFGRSIPGTFVLLTEESRYFGQLNKQQKYTQYEMRFDYDPNHMVNFDYFILKQENGLWWIIE